MKKFLLTICSVVAIFVVFTAVASASESESDSNTSFHPGQELRRSACGNAMEEPVINVEQKVKNDADSGVAGNAWAFDNYEREIKVYRTTEENSYCAIVKYEGKFITLAGPSPNNTGTVAAGIRGEFEGGYRATFTGTLKSSPLKKTHGSIGTYDYACDTLFNCPGRVSWLSFYFDGVASFDQPWWGWIYHADDHGTWINASTGNVGDIL